MVIKLRIPKGLNLTFLINAKLSEYTKTEVKSLKGFYKASTVARLLQVDPQDIFDFVRRKESLVGIIINDEEMLVHPVGVRRLVASMFRSLQKKHIRYMDAEVRRRENV